MENYSVSLDPNVVKEAQEINSNTGRKLSSVINNLLKDWIEKHKGEKSNG